MSDRFRCDVCGRFISLTDLVMGFSSRRLVTPDSHFTAEEYETLCQDHKWQRYPGGLMTREAQVVTREHGTTPGGSTTLGPNHADDETADQ